MKNYHHPAFFSHIPAYVLYDAMMGKGSLYRIGKEFILYTSDHKHSLGCGCPAMKAVRVVNTQGDQVFEYLTAEESIQIRGKAEEHINFQTPGCEDFWEEFYKKNSYLRPLNINN